MKSLISYSLFIFLLIVSKSIFAEPAVFEDFSGSISFQKFTGVEENTELDTTNQNLIISMKGKSFSKQSNRTYLNLNDSTNLLQADISIKSLSIGNEDTQQAMGRLVGIFYSSAGGDISIILELGNRGNGFEAWYEMYEEHADGSFTLLDQATLSTGTLALDTPYTASINYDDNNTFSLTFDNGAPVAVVGPVKVAGPSFTLRRLDTRVRFGQNNSTPGTLDDESPEDGSTALVTAVFDNITTGAGLFDDFSSVNLDLTKWNKNESSRTITDQEQLKMVTHRQAGSDRITQRLKIRKQGLKYVGANVTLSSDSILGENSRIRGRVVDYLGNDTFDTSNGDTPNGSEGDIFSQLGIERFSDGRFRAFAYASRSIDADFNTETELFFEVLSPTNPIVYDQQYALAIEQVGTVVNYMIDNEVLHSFDLATHALLNDNIYQEVKGQSAISARVHSGSGKAVVLFDDITTDSVPVSVSLNVINGDGDTVAFPVDVIVNEGELVTLNANIADPSTVQSYIWEQTAGMDVDVQSAATKVKIGSSNTLVFNVPAGSDTQNLAFELTVLNDAGVESSQKFNLNVDNSATPTLAPTPVTPPTTSSGGGGTINPLFLLLLLMIAGVVRLRSRNY